MIPVLIGLGMIRIFRFQDKDCIVRPGRKGSAERLDGRQRILTLHHRASIKSKQKDIGVFRQIEAARSNRPVASAPPPLDP